MYLGDAASGLLSGIQARDQLDLQQGALEAKRLFSMREAQNRQMQTFIKLNEIINENPVAGLELVRNLGPNDLSDTHKASLLIRAHRDIPSYMEAQQKSAGVLNMSPGAARYIKDPRFVQEADKARADAGALGEILDKTDDPVEAGQELAKRGLTPARIKEVQDSLFPMQMGKLKAFEQYWSNMYKKAGEAAALGQSAVEPTMPGRMPRPVAPGTPTVGQVEAEQERLKAQNIEAGKRSAQPNANALEESLIAYRQAQTLLERARYGEMDRKAMDDTFRNILRLAQALREMNNYRFEQRIYADPKRPEPVVDFQTGETLADKLEKMAAEMAMRLGITPEQASQHSTSGSSAIRGRVPVPLSPTQQVPSRPRILDIERID